MRISVNNNLRGSLGEMSPHNNRIRINVRAHRGDRAELASTLKHEILHVKYPNMTEKEVYKRSAKTKIDAEERAALLAKLSGNRSNRQVGINRAIKAII